METMTSSIIMIDASPISQLVNSTILLFAKNKNKVRIPPKLVERPQPQKDKRPNPHQKTNNGVGSHKK